MRSVTDTPSTIDAYIAGFPPAVQARLHAVRVALRQTVPEASEAIKYGIPTLVLHGNLLHFGAFQQHLGFYPGPDAIVQLRSTLKACVTSKGAIQFPFDQPLPLDLIRTIALRRRSEALNKAASKQRPVRSPRRIAESK